MADSEADSAGPGGDQPDRSTHNGAETLPPLELEFYDMSKEKHMIIFNHYDYDDNYPEFREKPDKRHGTMRDVKALQTTFGNLKFDVNTYHDKTHDEILHILRNLCEQNHSATSCMCVCVLTHGESGGRLCARDKMYDLNELVSILQDCAPGLVGKPKLVVVQACRGARLDAGRRRRDGRGGGEWLPAHLDTMVLTSCVEDYKSFRTSHGSWLVQELCRVVDAKHRELDVLQIITLVTSLVARERVSYSLLEPTIHNKKQTPEVRSTLTKLLRLCE